MILYQTFDAVQIESLGRLLSQTLSMFKIEWAPSLIILQSNLDGTGTLAGSAITKGIAGYNLPF